MILAGREKGGSNQRRPENTALARAVRLIHVFGDWLRYKLVMHVCNSLVLSTLLTSGRCDSTCYLIRFVLPILSIHRREGHASQAVGHWGWG